MFFQEGYLIMSGYEPFYIDTNAFRNLGSTYSYLPSQIREIQSALIQLSSIDPSYASTFVPQCEGLVFEINSTVSKIIAMHAKAKQAASRLDPVVQVVDNTIHYLNETAEDMEQTEQEAISLARNWSAEWMDNINPGV